MSKINENIIGYDLVKNVASADGYEYCAQNYLFAVQRYCDDYLLGLMEVRENTSENYKEMKQKFPFDKGYIVWHGTIRRSLTGGCDEIKFYWS